MCVVFFEVGVLCPSGRRNFYLNITPNNVVGFYSLEESGQPLRMKVRELTDEDFLMLTEEPTQLNYNCSSVASPQLERQLEAFQSPGTLFSTVSSKSASNQCARAGSFSNARLAVNPSGPSFSSSGSVASAKLNAGSCSTGANSTGRSFAVSSIMQRASTPVRTPLPSPLRTAPSHVPNLMPHRMQSVPFQSRPASVQPSSQFSPRIPRPLLPRFPQSNSSAGLGPSPDTTATTLMHNSFMSKENLSDNRSNSQSSQSTFRFKKLSTTKSPPNCPSTESMKDPVKEATSAKGTSVPSSVWNSNDYSGKKANDAKLFSSGSYLIGAKVGIALNSFCVKLLII